MKKGFTLVELLVVIIILSIIMLIAVPSVLGKLAEIRQSAFMSEVQFLYKAAEQQFTINKMLNLNVTCYNSSEPDRVIDTIGEDLIYKIYINDEGSITSVYVYNPVTLFEYYNNNVKTIGDVTIDKGTLKSNIRSYNAELFTSCS